MKINIFLDSLFGAVLALSIFILIYAPIEFLVTEHWFLIPRIPPLIVGLSLLFLVLFLNLINWNKAVQKSKLFYLFLVVLVFLSAFVYRKCRREKLAREYLPKIYSFTMPRWGIQANIIDIRGKNFFPPYQKGKAFLGNDELLIEKWTDELITVKQQVPSSFGKTTLYLVREDGVESNKIDFKIRDPDELLDLNF